MKTILRQLYDGELFPAEQFHPKTKEYKQLWEKNFTHYEDFTAKLKKLNPDLSREFEKIMDEQLAAIPLDFYEMFVDGFRLGARMAIEIYENDISCSK